MEEDKTERIVTTSTSKGEKLVSKSLDDSKTLIEFVSQIQTEVSVAKEVEDSKNKEGAKDSNSNIDFNSVSASFTEIEMSLLMVPKSTLHGCTAEAEIQLDKPKVLDASGNSENSNPDVTLSDSSRPPSSFAVDNFDETTENSNSAIILSDSSRPPSSFAVDNFDETSENSNPDITRSDASRPPSSFAVDNYGETTESSAFPQLLEFPSSYKPKFQKPGFFCGTTNSAQNEISRHHTYEQQNQNIKRESPSAEEIFDMELCDRDTFSNRNKTSVKSSNSPTSTEDEHEDVSAAVGHDFLPGSGELLTDEFLDLENGMFKIGKPPLYESFGNANWPALMRNAHGLGMSPDSGNTSESSNDENKEVRENQNETDHIMDPGKNIAERAGEWIECKKSNLGYYYEVSRASISKDHIAEVLKRMRENHYLSSGNKTDLKIYGYCKFLFQKSNRIKVVNNEQGTLCERFPSRIIVPYERYIPGVERKTHQEFTIQSSGATSRDKFIIPTILFQEYTLLPQLICRCAALSVQESAEHETAEVIKGDFGPSSSKLKHIKINSEPVIGATSKTVQEISLDLTEGEQREKGKKHLALAKILQIPELMIEEQQKKLWISFNPAANLYEDFDSEFDIVKLPFPDCDFFTRYRNARRNADGLLWDGSHMGSDVVTITQNYVETILKYLVQEKQSMVLNCMSGCNQTSLFIVLLRISLWADGKAHIALDCFEIAYLTLANDWYFAGHNLPDCLKRGEEILHFCYNFLQYLVDDKFSPVTIKTSYMGSYGSFRSEENKRYRMERINAVRNIVLKLYDHNVCLNI